jgi:putative nucleotidyltransferase with HDIG domain
MNAVASRVRARTRQAMKNIGIDNDTELSPAVQEVLESFAANLPQPPSRRELRFEAANTIAFLAAAAAMAVFLPAERSVSWHVALTLVVALAITTRVKFEVGNGYGVGTQLAFIPMLLLLPAGWVPLAVLAGALLGHVVSYVRRQVHVTRVLLTAGDCWYAVGPALVVGFLAPGEAAFALLPVYLVALFAQFAFDLGAATIQDRVADGAWPDLRMQLRLLGWICLVDLLLAPVGLAAGLASADAPYAFLLALPIAALLGLFARERSTRIKHAVELGRAYRGTTLLLSDVLEHDDEYTGNHSHGVVALALTVAQELGMDSIAQRNVEFGALLHDVGKIAIPKEIINKPGPLDDAEWLVIKTHTVEGQRMLDRVGGVMQEIGQIVRSSHERWDGGGYPDGLSGEAIPRAARVVSCCDAFNAMTTDRSYRKAMSYADAIVELKLNAGTQFDPEVVSALIAVLERDGQTESSTTPASAAPTPAH